MTDDIIGKKIVDVRQMTPKELEAEGWMSTTLCMVLEDGTLLYPSRDSEGNDGGALFGKTPQMQQFGLD